MKFIYLVTVMLLYGCSTNSTSQGDPLVSRLLPIHPKNYHKIEANYEKKYFHSFVDNDGNEYATWWESVGTFDPLAFDKIALSCGLNNIDPNSNLFSSIPNLKLESVSPIFYKPIVSCISKGDYILKKSEAYYPIGFTIVFGKTFKSYGETVGAKGKISIYGKRLSYSSILDDVKACYDSSHNNYAEGEAGGYIYVSVEGVVKEYSSCLNSLGYNTVVEE